MSGTQLVVGDVSNTEEVYVDGPLGEALYRPADGILVVEESLDRNLLSEGHLDKHRRLAGGVVSPVVQHRLVSKVAECIFNPSPPPTESEFDGADDAVFSDVLVRQCRRGTSAHLVHDFERTSLAAHFWERTDLESLMIRSGSEPESRGRVVNLHR